jgi:hypothetical protein
LNYQLAKLGSQSTELFGDRENVSLDREHLSFLYHVYQFNSTQSATGRVEGFEADHWPDDPFDGPVVLLNQVVQILALMDFDVLAGFLLKRLDSGRIGAALIDRDLVR